MFDVRPCFCRLQNLFLLNKNNLRFPEKKIIALSNTKNAKTQKLFEIQLQLRPLFMVVQLSINMKLQNYVWNLRYIIKSFAIKKIQNIKIVFLMFVI